jgi:hypothetical protein
MYHARLYEAFVQNICTACWIHLTTLVQRQFNPFNVLTVVNNHCSRVEFKPITSQRNTGYIPDCRSNLQHEKDSGNPLTPNILVRLIYL